MGILYLFTSIRLMLIIKQKIMNFSMKSLYKKSCTSSVSGCTLQRWEHRDILESVCLSFIILSVCELCSQQGK